MMTINRVGVADIPGSILNRGLNTAIISRLQSERQTGR